MNKQSSIRRWSVKTSHSQGVLTKETFARMQPGANRCRSGYIHRIIVKEERAVLQQDGAIAKQDACATNRGAADLQQGSAVPEQDAGGVHEDGAVALEFALLLPSITLLLTIGLLLGSTVLASIQSQSLAYNAVTLLTTNQTSKAGLSAKLPTLNKAKVTVSPSFPQPGDFVTVTVERDLFEGISFMPVITLEHKASAIQQVKVEPYG